MQYLAVLLLSLALNLCAFAAPVQMSLKDAESLALSSSWQIKAAGSDLEGSTAQEKSGLTALMPRVYLQGSYTYLSTLPQVAFQPGGAALTFGDHHNYSLGPTLSYTLWDSFSSLKNYAALTKSRQARETNQEMTRIQVLTAVRAAYLRVQLAIEELALVTESVKLARAQEGEVQKRFSAGAATVLETYPSKRQVLHFQLQLQQKQAELATSLKDLITLTNADLQSGMGEAQAPKLDPLSQTLAQVLQLTSEGPSDAHPQVKGLELLSESSDLVAEALRAKLFPTLQITLSSNVSYPNGPQLININQNSINLSLNVPLFLGDPTWQQIEQRRAEARATHFRSRQAKLELLRDYEKAQTMIASLKEQQKLAAKDIKDSSEIAKLYYSTYKLGKLNFIDVQSANNDALQAKVNKARIDAQLIGQLFSLLAIEGKEGTL